MLLYFISFPSILFYAHVLFWVLVCAGGEARIFLPQGGWGLIPLSHLGLTALFLF